MSELTTEPATASNSADLKYPIGGPARALTLSVEERNAAIEILAAFPQKLAAALDGLSEAQLETPYRPEGWTIRQLVHHIADSHLNAYSRFRHAITQDWPTIYAYDQAAWAKLPDARELPVAVSLQMIDGIHQRLVFTMRQIPDAAWSGRGYVHPENGRQALDQVLPLYAWHSRHHLAHIVNCRQRHGW